MSCSRRDLLIGTGAIIFTTGITSVAASVSSKTLTATMSDGKKRYGMVFDSSACIGCTKCEEACRETNNVPDGVSRLEIIRSAPIGEHPDVTYRFDRNSCQHCDNAPCVHVCPTGAAYKDEATGIIDVESDKCVGCGYCLAACPYQVRFFHPETGSADKCNFCRDTNLKAGKLPACVLSCPTNALVFGDLNDPNSEINKVIANNSVYRNKVELGTQPKLYKIVDGKGEIQR
ncbi:cytochrome c nitrite reductase Fe-S protein [Psychromonas hadalis]|uniref:cytochrome c nitrite reductase Fe-S protein n=1 Tax=Psychromonas hadalis TaxID=211669 RepID=UPI0003B77EE7|nr:cytochrome c nitrite reductase Fe-S protein [Psychromonas hadalis]